MDGDAVRGHDQQLAGAVDRQVGVGAHREVPRVDQTRRELVHALRTGQIRVKQHQHVAI